MRMIIGFVHRENEDSTIDSICTNCFQTVASGYSEPDIIRAEEAHACVPLYEHRQHNWEFHRTSV
jgi:hypothetical protein